MSLKTLLGALLIFDAFLEICWETKDCQTADFLSCSYIAALGCIVLIIVGIYLVMQGEQKENR